MANIRIARRYARGLLDAVGAEADLVLGQLETVVAFLEENDAVAVALADPSAPRAQRMVRVEGLITAAPELHTMLGNLFRLLTDRSRFEVLPGIARQYRELVDARLGRVRGKVTSAVKLDDTQFKAIEQSLEKMTQRDVVLEAMVDKNLIGGVVAQVGSRVFDASLRSQLTELSKSLRA
jgi:F-type H+-transporting ATPase subunit delta